MSNRVVETVYRLRDQATEVLRRIRGGYSTSASEAERASKRIEQANRRQQNSLQGVLAKVGRLRFAYFAVAGAVAGAVRAIGSFARAASAQENAVRRLETALKNGKGATDEQIEALQQQAKELQKVTRFGDEATISAQAQLATFQLNADAIQQITPRVLDLAEGMRRLGRDEVDVEQAAILLGKALRGNAGDLSRYGVVLTDTQRELINFGNEQEKVAALAEAIDANYKGLAESLTPFEQSAQSTANTIGDFQERLGAFVTQSDAVVETLDRLREWFDRTGQAITENGATIGRFVSGTVAAFRVLKNTADIVFDAIALGANKLQRNVLGVARSIANGMAKVTFGSARETLNQFVEDADQRLADLEKSSEARFRKLGENAAEYIESGRDLSNAIRGQAQAQREANKASQEAQEAALEQKRAEQQKQEAIQRTRETLEQFGVDAQKIETGISTAARESMVALQQLATDGEASLEVLSAAAEKATEGFSQEEIKRFNQELKVLQQTGQITKQQFEALTVSVQGLKGEAGSTESEFNRLNSAILEANGHDLTNIASEVRKLGQEGKLSAGEIEKLQAAIEEKRKAMADTNTEQQSNTKATRDNTEAQQENADASEESAGRAVRLGGAIHIAAEAQAVFNKRLGEFQGGGTAQYIQHFKRSLEEALEVQQRITKAETALNRLREQGVDITDASAQSNRELRYELMELRGEEERIAEQRQRDQEEQLRLQIELARARGDDEELKLLQERQRLLKQIEAERERQERKERLKEQQRKDERDSRTDEADAAERAADAAEREARARGATSREDVLRIIVDVNQTGELQLSQKQINQIVQRVLRALGDDKDRT